MESLYIAIDFDGVLFSDDVFPLVGEPIEGAVDAVNRLYDSGHKLIINSCREGEAAEAAIFAMEQYGFKYNLFNNNHPDLIKKYGNDCRKIGADIYIDDKNLAFLLTGIDWSCILEMINDYIELKDEL